MAGLLRRSDLTLFGNQKGIVDINPKISTNALDLSVAKQKLDCPEIACPLIDHRGFGTPQGMGTVSNGDPTQSREARIPAGERTGASS